MCCLLAESSTAASIILHRCSSAVKGQILLNHNEPVVTACTAVLQPESLRSLRKVHEADSSSSEADSPHSRAIANALHHASLKVASWNGEHRLDTPMRPVPVSSKHHTQLPGAPVPAELFLGTRAMKHSL